MGFITGKTNTFSKDAEGVQHFPGGWRSNVFQGGGGPNTNFYRNLVIFQGGGVRTPYSPSGSAHDSRRCFHSIQWMRANGETLKSNQGQVIQMILS